MLWKKNNKFKINETQKVNLPGSIMKYGINQEGILYAIIRKKREGNGYKQELIGISINEGKLWNSELIIEYPNELRISKSGNCYVGFSNKILKVSETGKLEDSISITLEADQEIGSFVILENCFVICVQGKNKPNVKVLKTDLKGKLIWETRVPVNGISYEGVVEMRADNNWKTERKKDWYPENWLCLSDNEIIVSNDSILVSYFEMPKSGLGKSYIIDLKTGNIKWDSKPAPFESICCVGDGIFLIGNQGYGAFETQMINSKGDLLNKWNSVGKTVISKDKEISVIEIGNSKLYHSKLATNGKIIRGSKIDGYSMIHPVLDNLGNLAFWRNKELMIIDSKSKKHCLLKITYENEPNTSRRMLLYGEGQLIFSLNKELFILRTNLGSLEKSSWACKFGNNERNPVLE